MKQLLQLSIYLFLLQLTAGSVSVTVTPDAPPFRVGTVLNLTCTSDNETTFVWEADCFDYCFPFFNKDSATVSTLDRPRVKALTAIDNGNYTCNGGLNSLEIIVEGIGVFDEISLSPVMNNSYFLSDENGLINAELHCIGATSSGTWLMPDYSSVDDQSSLMVDIQYGSAILSQILIQIGDSSASGSGSGDGGSSAGSTDVSNSFVEGYYKCIAQDEDGYYDVIEVGLFYYDTVAPSINSLNVSDNPALLGTEVTLVCDVDSTGKPMITTYSWYHNGSYIVDTNDPMLIINITDIVDYGSYSCVVSNVFGEDSDTILLEQGLLPMIRQVVNVTVVSPMPYTVLCAARGYPIPVVTVDIVQDGGDNYAAFNDTIVVYENSTFIVHEVNVTSSDITQSGIYQCTAENMFGTTIEIFTITILVAPSVQIEQKEYVVIANDMLSITCKASGVPQPYVTFESLNDPDLLNELSSEQIINGNTITSVLTIPNITPSYTGQYYCIANNSISEVSEQFNITVQYSPMLSLPIMDVFINYTTQELVNIALSCAFTGKPTPTIQWYHNQQTQLTDSIGYNILTVTNGNAISSELTIVNIIPNNGGQYTCVATNIIGNATTNGTINITALPTVNTDEIEYILVDKESVNINCSATGIPQPNISWYKLNDTEPDIIDSSYDEVMFSIIDQTVLSDGLYQVTQIMTINPLTTLYTGDYYCIAENSLDTAVTTFNITVQYSPILSLPIMDVFINYTTQELVNIALSCAFTGKPTPTIQWYHNQQTQLTDSIGYNILTVTNGDAILSQLTIVNIIPNNGGQYTCVATNIIGNATTNGTINITALPTVNTDEIEYILVDKESVNINCSATGIPQPNISWYKLNDTEPDIIDSSYDEVMFSIIEQTVLSDGLYQVTQIMTINPLTTLYTGDYYCIAENSLDTAIATFNITVQYIPIIMDNELADYVVIYTQQSSITFNCTAISVPVADIDWYTNDKLIIPSDNKYIITSDKDGEYAISRLTILNISITDTGVYTCNASNNIGYATSNGSLTVHVQPQLILVSDDVTVNQPESVTLNCTCVGIPSPDVSWYDPNDTILIDESEKYNISNIVISDDYTASSSLTVINTDPFDAGLYVCNCSNAAGYDIETIDVTVHVKPSININQLEYTTNETENISIICSSTGIPSPILAWYRNETVLTNETERVTIIDSSQQLSSLLYEATQTLIITGLTDTDTNAYSCQAANEAGMDTITVALTVNYGPRLNTGLYNYTVNEFNSFNMSCQVEGRPHPSISWWFTSDASTDFSAINNDSNIITINAIDGQLVTSMLIISNTPRTNHGFYKCNSSNILGTVESVAFITVNFITDIIVSPEDQVIVQPNDVTFVCNSEGRPLPSLQWYNGTMELLDSLDYTIVNAVTEDTIINSALTINSVLPFDEGVYTCVAGNSLNNVSTNATLTVHVIPSISSPSTGDQFIANQSFPVSITCSSTGIPSPVLSWYKEGENVSSLLLGDVLEEEDSTPEGVLFSTKQTLAISATDSSDTGNYTCQAMNTAGEDIVYFGIFIQVPPVVTAIDNDRHIISIEDTVTTIQFNVTEAIPEVIANNILWVFSTKFSENPYNIDNIDITNNITYKYSDDKRTIMISDTHLTDDEGRYYMIAINPAGSHYDYTDVIVHGPPKLINGPSDKIVTNSDNVTFVCEGRADPQHDILWTFNNTPIASTAIDSTLSPRYLLETDTTLESSYGTLTVLNVQYGDRGIYECALNNTVDTINASATLKVQVTPVIHNVSSSLSINVTQPLTLYCFAIGYPAVTFIWRKNGEPIDSNATGISTETVPFNEFDKVNLPPLLDNIEYIDLIGSVGLLKFDSVMRDDTAQYTCTANNTVDTDASDDVTVTVLERPDPPTSVIINDTTITSRTVELSWLPAFDGNRDILGYQVYFRNYDVITDFEQIGDDYHTTNVTEFVVEDLIPYTKYEFKVLACNVIGCTVQDEATPTTPVRTLPDRPDSAPLNCIAVGYNSTSLSIKWSVPEQPNGIMEYYQILYTGIESAFTDYCSIQHSGGVNTTSNDTTFVLSGLNKGTLYSLSIIAYTVVGSGPQSTDNCTQATLFDVPEIQPLLFKPDPVTSTSIIVLWELPIINNIPCLWNGPIIQYRITYRQTESMVANNITINSTSVSLNYTISGLEKFTEYVMTVSIGTEIGFSQLSSISQPIRTLPDASSKPRNVQLLNAQDTSSISITWDEPLQPNGIITNYIIYYQASKSTNYTGDDFDKSEQNVVVDTSGQYTLTGLIGLSTYTITIAAVNGAGIGARSDVNMADTPPEAPPTQPAPSPGVIVPNERQFQIVLERPSTVNGPISHYHVIAVLLPDGNLPDSPPDQLFPSFDSFISYDDAIRYDGTSPVAYIAAEFSDDNFPNDNMYIIGDENEPDDGDYTNGLLKYDSSFTFFLRMYPLLDLSVRSTRQVGNRQYDVFSSSNYYPEAYVTVKEPANNSATIASVISVLMILLVAMTVTVIILLIIIFYRRRSQKIEFRNTPVRKDRGEVISITSDFSLSPIPSFQNPAFHDESDVDGLSQQFTGHPSIPSGEFGKIVDRLHANDNFMLRQEYDEICTQSPQPSVDMCLNPVNKCRNRYANIQAYDHSRVKLIPVESYSHDYINANFLNGYNRENEYIATQGPLPDTLGDFWRMVWDHNVITIVMLTNLVEKMRVKCSQYWPEGVGLSDQYANIRVSLTKCVTHADYCIRTFEIQANDSKEIRHVKQFHYLSWPDFGVPRHSTPLLQFLRVVRRNHKYTDTRPLIVHCSAGVGRTGTFVTIDTEMQRAKHEGTLNPYSYVRSMRGNRNHMVQTEAQYVFLHDGLLEVITTGWTDIGIEQLSDRMAELEEEDDQGETGYSNEFNRLKTSQQFINEYGAAMSNANKFKNRIINALPYDYNRVKLSVTPGVPGSDYINASYIDGYKSKSVFIATQGPLGNTEDDFWRMIWEQEIAVVVMLCNAEERGQVVCHQYWPLHAGADMAIGQYHVICEQELIFDDYIRRELKITFATNEDKGSRTVHHYQYTSWPRTGAPMSGAGIIDMLDQIIRSQQQTGNKPVVVHCSAGVGRTGTFCALSIAIERAKVEQVVNLFDTVKHLRTQRAHMVQTLDQYVFCYRAMLEYIDSLSNYANFQTSI